MPVYIFSLPYFIVWLSESTHDIMLMKKKAQSQKKLLLIIHKYIWTEILKCLKWSLPAKEIDIILFLRYIF